MRAVRTLITLAFVAGAGLSTGAVAAEMCDGVYDRTPAGICPLYVQGDATCADAAEICGFVLDPSQTVEFTPTSLPQQSGGVWATIVNGTEVQIEDVRNDSQQKGRKGFEATITRRNGSLIMCGDSVVLDQVQSPINNANKLPANVTVCFARGPCPVSQGQVATICGAYDTMPGFVQAFEIEPQEQDVNLCGCGTNLANFCNGDLTPTAPGEVNSCLGGDPLTALDAISMGTIGNNTCVYEKVNGRRMKICD
ncbi:hypothetical protein [Microbaculum sp. FT89]|uniref:hypothetical protein n=1 Tax=Microbaculum sp. FT89 TaxID=3447298 RepID=UPI003F52E4B4